MMDLDATLLGAHSEKRFVAPTYKKGFGSTPSCATSTGRTRRWRACSDRATPGPTPPLVFVLAGESRGRRTKRSDRACT
ncbi:MAG: hypothetical protein ACRDJK_05755, partial [Actinomycetota bacterium]